MGTLDRRPTNAEQGHRAQVYAHKETMATLARRSIVRADLAAHDQTRKVDPRPPRFSSGNTKGRHVTPRPRSSVASFAAVAAEGEFDTVSRLETFESARELVRSITGAVEAGADGEDTTQRVADVLQAWTNQGGVLPSEFVQASHGPSYGRRALHVDKDGKFGIIVMTWSPGQETAIHDHDDMWCVECVYKGRVKISAFDCVPHAGDLFHLYPEQQSFGDVGNAGQLIPPKDVHKISNASEDVAVTIHVYGGHMEKCQIFSPVDQGKEEGSLFKRESKSLYFTSDKPWSEMCG